MRDYLELQRAYRAQQSASQFVRKHLHRTLFAQFLQPFLQLLSF